MTYFDTLNDFLLQLSQKYSAKTYADSSIHASDVFNINDIKEKGICSAEYKIYSALFEWAKIQGVIGKNTEHPVGKRYFNEARANGLFSLPHIQFNFARQEETRRKAKRRGKSDWAFCYRFLPIDIDDFDYSRFDLFNLPFPPSAIIKNPNKPKSVQLLYLLSDRMYASNAEKERFMFVFRFLTWFYGGDINHAGYVAKNPFSREHETYFNKAGVEIKLSKLYSDIQEFIKAQGLQIDLSKTTNRLSSNVKAPKTAFNGLTEGRNSSLFNTLRFVAYRVAKGFLQDSTPEEAKERLQKYLLAVVANPEGRKKAGIPDVCLTLSEHEIAKVTRSIARWTIDKYDLEAQPKLIYSDAQREKSLRKRRANKEERLEKLMKLVDIGKRLSKQEKLEVAEKVGISLDTLQSILTKVRKESGTKAGYGGHMGKLHKLDLIKKMRKKRMKWAKIAEKLGMTESAAKMFLKDNAHLSAERLSKDFGF